MNCCFAESVDIVGAREACREAIIDAITMQLTGETQNPQLIDAVPTIGKTRAAAELVADFCEGSNSTKLTYLTHLTDNRGQFNDMVTTSTDTESDFTITHLPVLEEDCATARGAHGEGWRNRILELRRQGVPPSTLHRDPSLNLPCGGIECEYMDWWRADEESDLLIGHVSHAYVPEVVDDRIVVIDEDPEDAFRTRFDANRLHQALRTFLDNVEGVPASNLDTVRAYRNDESASDQVKQILDEVKDVDRSTIGAQVLQSGEGHVDAANAIQALLVEEVPSVDAGSGSYRVVLENGVEYARLDDQTVAAYDPDSGRLEIRRTPDFTDAAAVVALDGTPTVDLWKGWLGEPDLNCVRVLCDECRQIYLEDVMGYRIIQTSSYLKPYSGATVERISLDKDRGLLHEILQRVDGRVGLITTKQVLDEVLHHEDDNQIPLERISANHFRNIRGSNEFAGDEVQVGVILGSPHPGPDELRLLAGLNADSFVTERIEETRDGHYYSRREPKPESEPYLTHVRENAVAQAALRFGRTDGATVFVHTAALPEWMANMADEATIQSRPAGERAVLQALQDCSAATTSEIAELAGYTDGTARRHLRALTEQGLVNQKGSDHRHYWEPTSDLSKISPTAKVEFPDDLF